jgi:ABC-type nickel/cobalt efflux system permease component RcnA
VIDAQVAVLADALGVQGTVFVLTLCCQLSAPLGVIAIFAHSVGIVLFISVTALRNNFSMLLEDRINFAYLAILRALLNTLGLLTLN